MQSLADTFERGNYDAVQRAMMRSTDLANTIRAFRMSDSPWPDAPRKTAVFALEMALAGLRSDNSFARDEGGRLLAEYHTRVRQPNGPDDFECLWFVTEAYALEGLFLPESAMIFIPRAVQRCPTTPRLRLAFAFVTEQQWMRGSSSSEQDAEVVRRYEDAMKSPETEVEARVRAARFLNATGNSQRALEVLAAIKAPSPDREVHYFTDLVRGQVLRSLNRPDEAAAALRAALATWPDAQSARVALMTLLVNQGKVAEAGALAEAAQTAPARRLRSLVGVLARRLPHVSSDARQAARDGTMRAAARTAIALVLSGLSVTAANAQDPAPVFRAGADVVSVEASVRQNRRPVTG